jgi:uncharacterized protein (TIGR02246 family)
MSVPAISGRALFEAIAEKKGGHRGSIMARKGRSTEEMAVSPATSTPAVANQQAALDAYYGEFTSPTEKEALGVPLRLVAAWANNDAQGVADVFTADGILILPGDVYKKGREEVHAFMAAAYAGPFKNSKVTGRPVDVRFVGEDIALLRTHGGILAEGETEISDELAVRSTWVVVKRDGEWKLAAYQNSPRGGGATLRW